MGVFDIYILLVLIGRVFALQRSAPDGLVYLATETFGIFTVDLPKKSIIYELRNYSESIITARGSIN